MYKQWQNHVPMHISPLYLTGHWEYQEKVRHSCCLEELTSQGEKRLTQLTVWWVVNVRGCCGGRHRRMTTQRCRISELQKVHKLNYFIINHFPKKQMGKNIEISWPLREHDYQDIDLTRMSYFSQKPKYRLLHMMEKCVAWPNSMKNHLKPQPISKQEGEKLQT